MVTKTALRRHYRKKTLKTKVDQLAKIVNRRKPEIKYTDTSAIASQFNWSPTVTYVVDPLVNLAIGTGDSARVGDTINVKSINIKMQLFNSAATPFHARLVFVRVKQNPENLITSTNVGNMFMESAYSGASNSTQAPFDNDNRFGFQVLWDRHVMLNPNPIGDAGPTYTYNSAFVQKTFYPNKETEFFQGGTAQYTKNAYYLLLISHDAAVATKICNYVIRTRYTDI